MPHGDADRFPVGAPFEYSVRGDGARVEIVGEHNCRAYKDAIFKDRWFVHERIVLNLAVVTEHDASTYICTATDDASGTQSGAFANLSEGPYGRAFAKHYVLGDFGAGMDSHNASREESGLWAMPIVAQLSCGSMLVGALGLGAKA